MKPTRINPASATRQLTKLAMNTHQPSSSVFDHFKSTFETALAGNLDAHTADQMDTVLAGAIQYSRWACSREQVLELRRLWISWKKLYALLDED